jgi:hypothetical protein
MIMGSKFDRPSDVKQRSAIGTTFARLLHWMLGLLLLLHLVTWISQKPGEALSVPDWAEALVWSLFLVPMIPALIAGVPRLQGRKIWKPVVFGMVIGALTPLLGIVGLISTFLLVGGNVDLGPHDESISDLVIITSLFSAATFLGVVTALLRHHSIRIS